MIRARPYHHGSLADALLDAAEPSLENFGVEQLSLRELARSVGVSHAAPRTHFPDRQALLEALAERGFNRLGTELRAAYDEPAATFEVRLRATMNAYVVFAGKSPALLTLMFDLKPRSDAAGLRAAADDALSMVSRLVEDGAAAGALTAADPDRLALLLAATVRGIVSLVTSESIQPAALEQLISDAAATFIRGNARTP